MADRIVGLTAVGAILAALLARQQHRTRRSVSTCRCSKPWSASSSAITSAASPSSRRSTAAATRASSRTSAGRTGTSDGYICALVYNDKQWQGFLRAIGRESLLHEDARFATFASRSRHIDFVYGELARIFEQRSTAEWMALLEEADVPMMPMHDLESVLDDPHLVATKFFTTGEHPSEGTVRSMRMPMTWSDTAPSRCATRRGSASTPSRCSSRPASAPTRSIR